MNLEVTQYIQKLPQWQVEICESLREMVYNTISEVQERVQYGKPHYLKEGHYAAVIHASKDKISFMIFNASELPEIKGVFKSTTSPERKTASFTEGQEVDYKLFAGFLKQASDSL